MINRLKLYNRDLSWLQFNARVLQEACDLSVPLYERIKFLAIWSSNLEEFYRIRVAEHKRLMFLAKSTKRQLREDPRKILKLITKAVMKQQAQFDVIFWQQIVGELEANNIFFVNDKTIKKEHLPFVEAFFTEKLKPLIKPTPISLGQSPPNLDEKSIYMAVRYTAKKGLKKLAPGSHFEYAVVEVPSQRISRFVVLPEMEGRKYVMILGDVVRLHLQKLFPEAKDISCFSFKVSRDAELVLEDEFSGSLLKKIKRGLASRDKGSPTRLQFDKSMPKDFLKYIKEVFGVSNMDLMPGGRYHNFSDLFNFPVLIKHKVSYDTLPQLRVKALENSHTLFDALRHRDYLLHFPYHSFDYVIRLLNEAAEDENVFAIKITLYRVARNSKVIAALLKAAENGKKVTAFVELKARFDEESNITYAHELEEAGVKVLYSFPILKVHAKMILIERREQERTRRYTYLSTGNFNENTAKIYSDLALMTYNKFIGKEVASVFDILSDTRVKREFSHLLVAPDHMRHDLYTLIDEEIKNQLRKKNAYIILKMNSLQDPGIIAKLYEASCDGVKIKIIVRGICCLVPGVKDLSENIKVISIVDRFLEHARVFIFCNNGQPKVFLSSADWMERNLSRRYEVGFPILDPQLKQEMIEIVRMQWQDNVKARIINKIQNNSYRKSLAKARYRAQLDIYEYLKEKEKGQPDQPLLSSAYTPVQA